MCSLAPHVSLQLAEEKRRDSDSDLELDVPGEFIPSLTRPYGNSQSQFNILHSLRRKQLCCRGDVKMHYN